MTGAAQAAPEVGELIETVEQARAEIRKVIIGQDSVLALGLTAILANRHALIEGVPGVGKTLIVRTLAHVLGCEFTRIQFTPDLMPADLTGTNIFNLQTNTFTLAKGPVFTTFLLADEINRAPAKTQAALLQAMQERTVTIDRETYSLSPNFTVFATQNPIEYEGTYPLPEAQKDRFMLKIPAGPPERHEELELARRTLGDDAPEATLIRGAVQPVLTSERLANLRLALRGITVREEMLNYIVDIVRTTRHHETVLAGAGPRATQVFVEASRVQAMFDGRDFVTPDDVKAIAAPVLSHRLVLRPEYEIEGHEIDDVIRHLLEDIPVPQ